MKENATQLPVQKISMSKKGQTWREECVDYVVSRSSDIAHIGSEAYKGMKTGYDLYNSIYDEKELKYVTDPFNQPDGFPAKAQNINLIKPKIDVLLGEEANRPFDLRVRRTSEAAIVARKDTVKQMIEDYVMAEIMSRISPENQQRYQQAIQSGEVLPPEEIYKYATKDSKDIAELSAYYSLMYLKQQLNLKHEFFKGYKDGLLSAHTIYYVGVVNGEPYMERVNPLEFAYDRTADLEFIHESEWCCRRLNMSISELYDRFYDKFSEKQLNELLSMIEDNGAGYGNHKLGKNSLDFQHVETRIFGNADGLNDLYTEREHINIWHACWKSFKKIGFVSVVDPSSQEVVEFEVDEDYKVTGEEIAVEWRWITEVWEGYRAGKEFYFGIQPLEYQHISATNINSTKLPYTGCVYNMTNSKPKSLVELMKPLQYLYIIMWYRLELIIAKDHGRIPLIDITQIPKDMGIDEKKWLHYLTALGVAFVNPYDKSSGIKDRNSNPSQFNQFSALDLSNADSIDRYIQLLSKIEMMIDDISGVSQQREGEIGQNEQVGTADMAVKRSANITEPWVWMHSQVKKHAVTMLLNTAKAAWKGKRKYIEYILDDATRSFCELSDDFFYEDMDIFVDESTKAQQEIETIRALYQPAMQNGASLRDIAEIMSLENITAIKGKLEEIEQKHMEQQQQMQQQEAEMQQQLEQQKQQSLQIQMQMKQMDMEMMKYKTDQDNATRIMVAELQVFGMNDDTASQEAATEVADDGLDILKVQSDMFAAQEEKRLKEREIDMKDKIEQKKLDLEKQKMDFELKLQKQKDQAALVREKLKARTALKNKTNAEAARSKTKKK
jgi:hypothetical protein